MTEILIFISKVGSINWNMEVYRMEAYTGFAQVYDLFMDNVPYQEWSQYIIRLLQEYKIEEGLVLELGCGTGKMTRLLSKAGYDMIGVDNSEEMLRIAEEASWNFKEKDGQSTKGILYLLQDMREFELYGTVRAVISVCDSINYILEEEELLRVFQLVNNYLDPEGIFIFDINTIYKYKEILGERVICENREEGSFIWENYYDKEENINQYDLTIYVQEKNHKIDGKKYYQRYEETHFQRGYEIEQIKELLERAGMEFLAVFDACSYKEVEENSERVYIIAREQGKIIKRKA